MSDNKPKIISLNLPDFAFLMGSAHGEGGDLLKDRTVLMHVRTASVVEIFNREDVALNEDTMSYKFSYTNRLGGEEKMIVALHFCGNQDLSADREFVKQNILRPAAVWYCDYCTWEDKQISLDDIANELFKDDQ